MVSEALAAKHRADSPLCVHPFSRSEAAKGNEVSKSRTDACLCRESNFNTLFFKRLEYRLQSWNEKVNWISAAPVVQLYLGHTSIEK